MYRIFRINENSNSSFISFVYKGNKIMIDGDTPTKVYNSFLDWIDEQGYTFPSNIHNTKTRRVYSIEDLERTNLDYPKFHNINNKNLFIPNSSLFLGGNVELKLSNMIIMLKEFGVDTRTIDSNGFKGRKIKEKTDMISKSGTKMTFINAAQLILKENGNKPMSANDIWDIIDDRDLVETKGTTPWSTLNAQMLQYSDNSNTKFKYKKKLFTITETNPAKFKLIKNEVQDVDETEEGEDYIRVFVVRAGRANADSNSFIDGNFVGIGYGLKFNINDKSKEQIFQFLTQNGALKNQAIQHLQQLELFKEISVGDLVLVPDSEGINVGEVSSDIYYVDEKYPNRLEVEWIDKIEKNNSVNLPRSVFEIKNFDTENFEFTSSGEFDPELTPVHEPEEEKEIMSPYDFFSSTTGAKSTYSIKDDPTIVAPKPDKYDITLTRDPQKANKIEKISSFTGHKTNPFRQAICVLGKSGMGKSTTIEKVLISLKDNMKMEYEYIIPTASTTNLLAQYSPGSNRYIQSRLGKLIMKAQKNPERLFTAVFDECHKANVIEMINDELLQAISTYRNLTKRFISVDDDTAELYDGLTPDNSGNLLIPNNFGFIFLSSKPNIIIDNADFFNRVDIYVLENQPPKDEVDLCTVIGSSIILNQKYFESIGDRQNGSKTAADVDRIKELHK